MLLESSRDLSPLAAVTCSHTGCPFTEYRARVTMHFAVVDVLADCYVCASMYIGLQFLLFA